MNKGPGQQGVAMPRYNKKEFFTCQKCKCNWFEQLEVQQYELDKFVVLGQRALAHGSNHYILRCIKCGDLQELQVNMSGSNKNLQDTYVDLTTQLDEKPKEE